MMEKSSSVTGVAEVFILKRAKLCNAVSLRGRPQVVTGGTAVSAFRFQLRGSCLCLPSASVWKQKNRPRTQREFVDLMSFPARHSKEACLSATDILTNTPHTEQKIQNLDPMGCFFVCNIPASEIIVDVRHLNKDSA